VSTRAPARAAPTAAGTTRRLRALAARSWTPQAIEQAAGIPARDVQRLLSGYRQVPPDLAAAVAGAYDRLWDRRPPQAGSAGREDAAAMAAGARRSGWAPPMAWDDDQIDLPDGQPARGWKPGAGSKRKAADLAEDATWVRQQGGYRHATEAEVAMRLGVTKAQLEKALSRARGYAGREAEAEAG
jgi:hypothetical protein